MKIGPLRVIAESVPNPPLKAVAIAVPWTARARGHNLGLMKHIAVLTSGGDAPGMNAAIRAVTRSALDEGMTVSSVLQGWQGLVDGQFRQLSARDVGGIIQVGGTFLGSARSAEFREESGRSKALRNLAPNGASMGWLRFRSVRSGSTWIYSLIRID